MSDLPVDITDSQLETIPRVGVTDAERELANNAHVEFESKQYDRYVVNYMYMYATHKIKHESYLMFYQSSADNPL